MLSISLTETFYGSCYVKLRHDRENKQGHAIKRDYSLTAKLIIRKYN